MAVKQTYNSDIGGQLARSSDGKKSSLVITWLPQGIASGGGGLGRGGFRSPLRHLLQSVSKRFQIQLTVLHLNHQLRGSESDSDEEFVRSIADSLELPAVFERAEIASGGIWNKLRDSLVGNLPPGNATAFVKGSL